MVLDVKEIKNMQDLTGSLGDPSILGCINAGGGCHRYIKRNKRGRDYLMSFIENKKQKK